MSDNENAIAIKEHDQTYKVKKVSNFLVGADGVSLEREKTLGFNIGEYDYIALTYVAAGNGAGEIETATFKSGGAGGTEVATLTLTYNASNEIATVTKT